ncbi:signal peptidase I [Proteus mirabilis]|nr:signal peptidase I [Providencia rettgeri]EMB4674624.1 signal peptidase I [Proteus mirabilis]EMB4675483.1 signal peptidase I [Proteus mirabilis]
MNFISTLIIALILRILYLVYRKRKPSFYTVSLVIISLIVWSVKSYLLDYYIIPTSSMAPTLKAGDLIFAKPVDAQKELLMRGDIVIFRAPAFPSFIYVKRIIGLAGDTVTYTDDKSVQINGRMIGQLNLHNDHTSTYQALQERYAQQYEYVIDNRKPFVKPIYTQWVIPDGYVFVLGDNRDHSWDSRFFENAVGTPRHLRGLVKKELLISRYLATAFTLEFMKSDFDIGENSLKVISEAQTAEGNDGDK